MSKIYKIKFGDHTIDLSLSAPKQTRHKINIMLDDIIEREQIQELIYEETHRNGNNSGNDFLNTQLNYNGNNKNRISERDI